MPMQDSMIPDGGMKNNRTPYVIGGIVVGGILLLGWMFISGDEEEAMMQQSREDQKMEAATGEVMEGEKMEEKSGGVVMERQETSVALLALNDSQQSGKAVLSDMGGKTKVMIDIKAGTDGVAQPAHIHMGACPNPGAVQYPLTNVVGGESETILDVPFSTLVGELPLAINVHKSKEEAKVYVSCGDITTNAMMEKKMEGAMMEKAGTYEPYDASKFAMAKESKIVLFFRASWCPTCRTLDADIRKNLSAIPSGVTIFDVDYDKYTDLKKQYGVTTQHTLVQVDATGAELGKWVGSTTLAEVTSKIK